MSLLDKIIKKYEQKNKEIKKMLDPKKKYLIEFQKTGKKQICIYENYGIGHHQYPVLINLILKK